MIFPVFVFSAGSYEVRYGLEPISKSHFLLFQKVISASLRVKKYVLKLFIKGLVGRSFDLGISQPRRVTCIRAVKYMYLDN